MSLRRMHRLPPLVLAAFLCAGIAPGDELSDLQTRFDRENNSVRKAKLLEKLGDAQFDATRRASQANNFEAVGLILEKYRDNARAALNALEHEHPDAERHTSGFKQLQMHVHRSLRELDEALLVAPPEYKPPLELVRRDLLSMDEEMLKLLFPRRSPEKKPGQRKSADPPAPEKLS